MPNTVTLGWLGSDVSFESQKTEYHYSFEGVKQSITLPLMDDVTLEVGSTFKPASSVIPTLGIMDTMFKLSNAGGGKTSRFQSMFEIQIWDKTNPIKIDLEVLFYTKSDPIGDVLLPVLQLMSLGILKKDPNSKSFFVPGVSLATLSDFSQKKPTAGAASEATDIREALNKNARFIAIDIPGVIHLYRALLISMKPTFSKQVTESGVPLWCKAQLSISGVWPAVDEDLKVGLDDATNPFQAIFGSLFD